MIFTFKFYSMVAHMKWNAVNDEKQFDWLKNQVVATIHSTSEACCLDTLKWLFISSVTFDLWSDSFLLCSWVILNKDSVYFFLNNYDSLNVNINLYLFLKYFWSFSKVQPFIVQFFCFVNAEINSSTPGVSLDVFPTSALCFIRLLLLFYHITDVVFTFYDNKVSDISQI